VIEEQLMSLSELDLELLETYLDGELAEDEATALRARLAGQPSLTAALDELRQQRELRQEVYASMECASDGSTADQINRALRAAMTREIVWSRRWRLIRRFSAAAACLAVGLFAGWFARGNLSTNRPVTDRDTTLVSNELVGQPRRPGGFNVQLTDDSGRVIAVQQFDSLNDAREFSNDLFRWQNKQRQMRNRDVRLIGDDF
jgi:hypothetical protein